MILSTDLLKLEKHPAITECTAVENIMLPLLKSHGITVFNYYKYTDQGIIRLSSHQKWAEHYFKKNYANSSTVPPSYLQKSLNYFIWRIEDCPAMLRDAAINFNISNGISIAKNAHDGIEFYGFGTTTNNTSIINNFYINNLDVLLNYCNYFKERADVILSKCEKNKIIISKQNVKHRTITFTLRQRECAIYLLQGMPYREIAEKLFLSHRTIETHIESLKTKFQCRNKVELILTLSKIL